MLSLNEICVVLPLASYGIWLILSDIRRRKEIKRKAKEQESEYYRSFFFGGKKTTCNHIDGPCAKVDCPLIIYSFFQDLIDNAQSSVDVCINVFTSKDIAVSLIKAHKKNILVRIIADKDMSTNRGSKVHDLIKYSVDVKMLSVCHGTHSKTLIIDRKKVLTGSANFTNQGLTANWENILVTTQKDIVREISNDFENLWYSDEVEPFDAKF